MRSAQHIARFAAVLLIAGFTAIHGSALAQSYVNFEAKLTRPISLSPDGKRLFAVNTPDARLSVFDISQPLHPFLIAEIPVGVEPVSVNARNNNEVWVVNEVSDSVSIISISNRMVVDTLHVKDEPADVVFAGGKAFVSASRNNQIAVFDVTTHTLLTNLAVFGENPRALAVNAAGTKVYAAFALSGNRTTLVPATNAPPQVTNGYPAMNPALPPPPKVGLIVDATDPAWTNIIRFTMPDNDVVELDVATLDISRYFPRVGTENLGLAVQPGSGDLFVANQEARNLTQFEPALRGFFMTNRVSRVDITNGALTHFDLHAGYHPTNFTLLDRTNALAQPTALVFNPGGEDFYLAAFSSDRIARIAADSGTVMARIELSPTARGSDKDPRRMRGPRGLALLPEKALYVLNRISGTISILDPVTDSAVREIPIGSFDPTPTVDRQGRGFLYDAKLSGNGTVSCASCHIDSDMDRIAWDLGDPQGTLSTNLGGIRTNPRVFHPMKGPLVTLTLRGTDDNLTRFGAPWTPPEPKPLHWRGDRTNFLFFNGAFASLLGGSTLSTNDMQAFREFIRGIRFEPNPNQTLSRRNPQTLNGASPGLGSDILRNNRICNSCHTEPDGMDSFGALFNLGDSQHFKSTHFRNLYQKTSFNRGTNVSSIGGFGFFHDGAFGTISGFEPSAVPPLAGTGHMRMDTNVEAFMLCFDTGTAPAVGYTITLSTSNVFMTGISNTWVTLEGEAVKKPNIVGTNIDLIIKGTIDGQRHGLYFQRSTTNYVLDTTNSPPLSRAQLVAKVLAGDTLTVMGVPFGSGQRMGIDRDLDGILDGDEPPPRLQITQSTNQAILRWPLNGDGFRLEETPDFLTSWNVSTAAVEIVNGFNYVTNSLGSGGQFFRLRKP